MLLDARGNRCIQSLDLLDDGKTIEILRQYEATPVKVEIDSIKEKDAIYYRMFYFDKFFDARQAGQFSIMRTSEIKHRDVLENILKGHDINVQG